MPRVRPRLGEPGGLRPFVWAGVLASLTQVIGITRRGFGSSADGVIVNGELASARPLTAAVALIMLIGMIVLLLDGRKVSLPKALLASWLAVSVVLSQHRSVWVAAAVAGLLVLRALVSTSRQRLVAGTFAGLGAAAVAFGGDCGRPFATAVVGVGQLDRHPRVAIRELDGEADDGEVGSGVAGRFRVRANAPERSRGQRSLQGVLAQHVRRDDCYAWDLLALGFSCSSVVGAIRASRGATPERVAVITLLAFGLFYQWPGVVWLVIGVAVAGSASAGRDVASGILRAHGRFTGRHFGQSVRVVECCDAMRVVHLLGLPAPERDGADACQRSAVLRAAGCDSVIVGQGEDHPYADELIAAGYRVRTIPEIKSIKGYRAWTRLLREEEPNAVHIHPEGAFALSVLAARHAAPDARIVRTFHYLLLRRGMVGRQASGPGDGFRPLRGRIRGARRRDGQA